MLCSFDRDYRAYQTAYEKDDAEQACEDLKKREEVAAALASCDPLKSIPFFGDIAYLLNEVASQEEQVNMAMCRALMEAAKRGERYAQDAIKLVSSHFVEVV